MKIFFLMTLLSIQVGCNNLNSTSSALSERNLPFDNTIYLTIPHQADQSILRRKLLNIELTNQLNDSEELDEKSQVNKGDEFLFVDDSLKYS